MATIGELIVDVKFKGFSHKKYKLKLWALVSRMLGIKVEIDKEARLGNEAKC